MLNNTFHTCWHEQQFRGDFIAIDKHFLTNKYWHCSHVAMQNIGCQMRAYSFEPRQLVTTHADTLICFMVRFSLNIKDLLFYFNF